mgnify:CR=1 FL=1
MKYKDLNSSNIIDIMLEEIKVLKKNFEARCIHQDSREPCREITKFNREKQN